ncbi:MAG: AbrB/MazE/SpoVT family DNA-binding domain-containing protein [Archaeoglobaceae archaeon]
MSKVLGTTKISKNNKITLVKEVTSRLNIKEGDLVMFVEEENGRIYIRTSEIK